MPKGLLEIFDKFYGHMDAVCVPAQNGGRRIPDGLGAIALSEVADELWAALASEFGLVCEEHGTKTANLPAGVVFEESDNPEGPWTPIPSEELKTTIVPIGRTGACPVLQAALFRAMNATAFSAARWNRCQQVAPGANHRRYQAGDVITADDLEMLESVRRLLQLKPKVADTALLTGQDSVANKHVSVVSIGVQNQGLGDQEGNRLSSTQKRFRVALSFPGEYGDYVHQVAKHLARALGPDRIFYDKYYEAELARPDLDIYLQRIYHDDSDLIAVFLCAEYERKEWCGLEWRAIRDLLKQKQARAIMPFRFDQTHIPGLFSIDGYVSADNRPASEIADLILQRLASNDSASHPRSIFMPDCRL